MYVFFHPFYLTHLHFLIFLLFMCDEMEIKTQSSLCVCMLLSEHLAVTSSLSIFTRQASVMQLILLEHPGTTLPRLQV